MYRIEIAPGEETVFRTLEEMAIGVRSGLVTPRSRIYHSASQKWLPIEFHPHYKKALASSPAPLPLTPPLPPPAREKMAPVAVAPARKIMSSEITFLELPPPEPLPPPAITYPEVTPSHAPVADRSGRRQRRSGNRALHLAMAGAVLIVCTYAVTSAAAPSVEAKPPAERAALSPLPPAAQVAGAPAAQPPKPKLPALPQPRPPTTTLPAAPSPQTPHSAPAVAKGSATIQPAPGRMDLALPSLPVNDSLANPLRDSAAIGRILRAVTGPQASPVKAATP